MIFETAIYSRPFLLFRERCRKFSTGSQDLPPTVNQQLRVPGPSQGIPPKTTPMSSDDEYRGLPERTKLNFTVGEKNGSLLQAILFCKTHRP